MVHWYMSAEAYLEKANPVIEERFGPLKALFSSCIRAPASPNFHPELDQTGLLLDDEIRLYQSYIGILRWAIELGRIELTHTGAVLSKFLAAPNKAIWLLL